MNQVQFFIYLNPPTVTAQEKKVTAKNGRVVMYEPAELKEARQLLTDHLWRYKPDKPMRGAVELVVTWCFPAKSPDQNGAWKITKPDTDNLNKMLKDCMTKVGFWKDDALVCREIIEKCWAELPGILIRVTELEDADDG